MAEFELIRRYFTGQTAPREDVRLGVGDDCALLAVPAGHELALTVDTLVQGTHFLADIDPEALGHKALAVNLSDLASMGAEPAWVTLAIALEAEQPDWLQAFSRGFNALANQHGVQLVGGDTTCGPLTITVSAHGFVPQGQALKRSGAKPGDLVCVTGTLGDAGLALRGLQGESAAAVFLPQLRERLERPMPRLQEGVALRGLASAAIDISDGLVSDLGHILQCSSVGARVIVEQLPLSPQMQSYLKEERAYALPLAAGDDYELCFTLPPERLDELQRSFSRYACGFAVIGEIEQQPGLRLVHTDGRPLNYSYSGYEHFSGHE